MALDFAYLDVAADVIVVVSTGTTRFLGELSMVIGHEVAHFLINDDRSGWSGAYGCAIYGLNEQIRAAKMFIK